MHLFSTSENIRKVFWCFQGVEKGWIGSEWVTIENYKFYKMIITLNSSERPHLYWSFFHVIPTSNNLTY